MVANYHKLIRLSVLVVVFFSSVLALYPQNNSVNLSYRIFQEAERLYRLGKYQASIDLIDTRTVELSAINDSLNYLKIKSLERIYLSQNFYTVMLDMTIHDFLQRVHRNIFPDNLYNEVVLADIALLRFQYADSAFYNSAKQPIIPLNVDALKGRNENITKYLNENANTYFRAELNILLRNNSENIFSLEKAFYERQRDSINYNCFKKVGKIHTLALSYSFPASPPQKFVFHEMGDVNHLLKNRDDSISSPVPDLALGLSLVNIGINLFTTKRVKMCIDWSLFDVRYFSFNIQNSILKLKPYDQTYLNKLQSFNIGTRIGMMLPVFVVKRISATPYFNVVPSVSFLSKTMAFVVTTDTTGVFDNGNYEIKPKIENFNLSYEFGVRIYFFENKYVSAYFQNGSFNWANKVTYNYNDTGSYMTRSNYKYQVFGVRIGF